MILNMRAIVAGNIRAEIARRGLNQEMLAHGIGLTTSALSTRMAGHVAFSVDDIEAVCSYLGVDPELLVRRF